MVAPGMVGVETEIALYDRRKRTHGFTEDRQRTALTARKLPGTQSIGCDLDAAFERLLSVDDSFWICDLFETRPDVQVQIEVPIRGNVIGIVVQPTTRC